jgi:hypothetical protein
MTRTKKTRRLETEGKRQAEKQATPEDNEEEEKSDFGYQEDPTEETYDLDEESGMPTPKKSNFAMYRVAHHANRLLVELQQKNRKSILVRIVVPSRIVGGIMAFLGLNKMAVLRMHRIIIDMDNPVFPIPGWFFLIYGCILVELGMVPSYLEWIISMRDVAHCISALLVCIHVPGDMQEDPTNKIASIMAKYKFESTIVPEKQEHHPSLPFVVIPPDCVPNFVFRMKNDERLVE